MKVKRSGTCGIIFPGIIDDSGKVRLRPSDMAGFGLTVVIALVTGLTNQLIRLPAGYALGIGAMGANFNLIGNFGKWGERCTFIIRIVRNKSKLPWWRPN